MSKLVIVIEVSGRQSEDMREAKWAVKQVVSHVGGYNEAFTTIVSDDEYESMAADESSETLWP